jgi:protein-disulfide isomerase
MAKAPSGGVRRFYFLLGGIAAVGLGALVVLTARPKVVGIPANVTVAAADTAGFRGYVLGSDSAPVEITEYADYQCPACAGFEMVQFPDVKDRLIKAGRLRWRYRDFPLQQHKHSRLSAHAAACANDQGRFWDMHRFVYEGQNDWADVSDAAAMDQFQSYARSAGLDQRKFDECMRSARYAGRIQASLDEGTKLGVNSTPTFVIGGRLFPGGLTYDQLRHVVDSLAAQPKR